MIPNPVVVDRRLVMEYERGQHTFRRINPNANYSQLLRLATAINSFQEERAQRVLLVTVRDFGGEA